MFVIHTVSNIFFPSPHNNTHSLLSPLLYRDRCRDPISSHEHLPSPSDGAAFAGVNIVVDWSVGCHRCSPVSVDDIGLLPPLARAPSSVVRPPPRTSSRPLPILIDISVPDCGHGRPTMPTARDRFRRLRGPRRRRGCAIATTIRGGDETEGGTSWDGVVAFVVVLTGGWIEKRWDPARPGKCRGGGGHLLAPDDDGRRGGGENR